jgi:hypothetical protein
MIQEKRILMCKGPGGVVEVWASYEDTTGAFTDIRVKGPTKAASRVRIAGVQKARSYDGRLNSASVADVSSYKVDESDPRNSIFPSITIES